MSAFLDNLTDGGYGDYSGGDAPAPSNDPGFTSGFLQNLSSLGTGYIARRLDVDLSQRLAGSGAYPQLRTTQNGIGGYGQVTQGPGGAKVAQINLSAVMPLLMVAAVVFVVAKAI